jgi:hypothetical protein
VSTVKQVAGEDSGGLLAQERLPRRARPPWRGVQTVAAQGCADRGRGDLHAKPKQLTLDALVAPAGILPGQADNQLLRILIEQWTPGSTTGIGPCTGDQAAVPAQEGLGLDDEAGPAGPGQRAADRGEQGPVGGFQPGSRGLAVEHGELVAQYQDLQVLGGVAAGQQHEQADQAAQREVGEFQQHRGWPSRWGRGGTLGAASQHQGGR